MTPEDVLRHYALWFGLKPTEREAAAIASEAKLYADLTRTVAAASLFDDEPSNYVHALAGRRQWRGKAR